jgi:hypothetical protein
MLLPFLKMEIGLAVETLCMYVYVCVRVRVFLCVCVSEKHR